MNTLALIDGSMWLPQASTFAPTVDSIFLLVTWFAVFLAVLVSGGTLYALLAPRGIQAAAGLRTSQLTRWVLASAVLLVGAFGMMGMRVWADMKVIPRGALVIRVVLEEERYVFLYPNGYSSTELHLPLNQPVRFALRGSAKPYAFAIPAFRLQVPVPMRADREAWVQASIPGEYDLRGARAAQAIVHPTGGWERWYEEISGPSLSLPPLELGQKSYQMRGCAQCHSLDGSPLAGPTFKGFTTREHKLRDGSVVQPTEEYIRESIQDPSAKVVEGYEPVMPSFKARLKDAEIAGLAAYIRSLP